MGVMAVTAQTYDPSVVLATLHDHPENPRRGDDPSVSRSIDRNGWYGAIIVQKSTRQILAGHTRRRALADAGVVTGPVIWVDCDDDTATAILLADNRTAELAEWDDEALVALLGVMPDVTAVGFTEADLTALTHKIEAQRVGDVNASAEWDAAGMPGYDSEERAGAYRCTVTFETDADADRFFDQIDHPKAKRFWWPQSDGYIGTLSSARVVAEQAQ
jgi:hypothetical protein